MGYRENDGIETLFFSRNIETISKYQEQRGKIEWSSEIIIIIKKRCLSLAEGKKAEKWDFKLMRCGSGGKSQKPDVWERSTLK